MGLKKRIRTREKVLYRNRELAKSAMILLGELPQEYDFEQATGATGRGWYLVSNGNYQWLGSTIQDVHQRAARAIARQFMKGSK